LTQSQAAAYCGLCASNFKLACPVQPLTMLDRIARYDRHDLDRWLDSLSTFRPFKEDEDLGRMWENAGDSSAC